MQVGQHKVVLTELIRIALVESTAGESRHMSTGLRTGQVLVFHTGEALLRQCAMLVRRT